MYRTRNVAAGMRTQLTGSTNLSLSNQTFRNFTNLSSVCTDKKSPDEIRRALLDGIELNDHRAVLTAFERAREVRLKLDVKDYCSILLSWTEAGVGRELDEFFVYDSLVKSKSVPHELFVKVLEVCAARGDGAKAVAVARDFRDVSKDEFSERALSAIIQALVKSILPQEFSVEAKKGPRQTRPRVSVEELDAYYDAYIRLAKEKSWRTEGRIYSDVAKVYSSLRRSDAVLRVLGDMTKASYEPSQPLCSFLLDAALFTCDNKLLRVLASWFVDNFPVRLDRGIITRMLQVASSSGDGVLAQRSLKLLEKAEHSPGRSDYYCWALASVSGDDVMGALDALVEAQMNGVDLLAEATAAPSRDADVGTDSGSDADSGTSAVESSAGKASGPGSSGSGLALQEKLAERLSRSIQRLDDFYYALVELLRSDGPVPRLALNTVIMAAGRMGQMDRAFATFEEYDGLFGLAPDAAAYNALLYATARSRQPSSLAALNILQTMEEVGFKPDTVSYSLLLDVMVESPQTLDSATCMEIVAHAASQGADLSVCPYARRSLRRLSVACAKRGDWQTVDELIDIMRGLPLHSTSNNDSNSGSDETPPIIADRTIPPFFIKRIESIREAIAIKTNPI